MRNNKKRIKRIIENEDIYMEKIPNHYYFFIFNYNDGLLVSKYAR